MRYYRGLVRAAWGSEEGGIGGDDIVVPPICSDTQAAAQIAGLSIAHVGAKVTRFGDGVAAGGIITAVVSGATGNLVGAWIGGDVAVIGGAIGVAGRQGMAIGSITAIAGGASIRQTGSQVITDMLPGVFLYHNAAQSAVDNTLDFVGVPDSPGCIIQ